MLICNNLLVDNVGIQKVSRSVHRFLHAPRGTHHGLIHSEVAFRSLFQAVLHRVIPTHSGHSRWWNMLDYAVLPRERENAVPMLRAVRRG